MGSRQGPEDGRAEHGREEAATGEGGRPTGGVSRRSLMVAGGTGVATAVVVGLGADTALAAPAPGPAQAAAATPRRAGALSARDPHAGALRTGRGIRGRQTPVVRILPLDNAKFLAGARFDLRVEVSGVDARNARVEISLRGPDGPAPLLKGEQRSTPAADTLAVTYRGIAYPRAGTFTVRARVTGGGPKAEATVVHEVVTVGDRGKGKGKGKGGGKARAKNVVFFLGDGMGTPAVTAARLLSKGITEGKYNGLLEMDTMEYRGLVSTSGADSIVTDSANSMSAYMTGHKSSVNAMGVYEGSSEDPDDHPRVENITELLKRTRGMSVGVVTTAEVQDATPAAVWAHTRRRSEYLAIMDQSLEDGQRPDVLMGGGLASFLPRSAEGSRRDDDRDLVREYERLGYTHVSTARELKRVAKGRKAPRNVLGLFHTGNLDVYLDRRHTKDPGRLGRWNDQPTLMEMTEVALRSLEQNDDGFFLVVEGASIDKMEHPLDGPRAAYDTIEFDQALGVVKRWAADRDDTLIVVTADHNHSMSIVGTHDRRETAGRAANGVYGDAGFPTYRDSNGDGFPDDPDPDVQLFFGWSNHPDHTDDFRHNPVFSQPALADRDTGEAVPNPERDGEAELQVGNLPPDQTNCVHTVEDVSVFASGVGAERFNAFQDNTELFFHMMHALALDPVREG
ncbi:alkaline phosphatase [Streptomyces lonarensis]|uniref:Alkaline phosphatase n=1 Tax=Streptomyces lonarensis TaxID=700599 RepID=A0A7X6D4U1_9ACTN|nr:alkaline phosphatase [Streptomyces lonarensis]NJQ08195.1 alkaline phosphatase [Streptomyces lonarensis]